VLLHPLRDGDPALASDRIDAREGLSHDIVTTRAEKLGQLLVRERWAKAFVLRADDGNRLSTQLGRQPTIAGPAAMLRCQADGVGVEVEVV
jgi:hypothetical protein